MSSNRLIYDQCAEEQQTVDSTKPLTYAFYLGKYENCNKCKKPNNAIDAQPFQDRVMLEGELRNIDVTRTSCDKYRSKQFDPKCMIDPKDKQCNTNPIITPRLCAPYREACCDNQLIDDIGYTLPSDIVCPKNK